MIEVLIANREMYEVNVNCGQWFTIDECTEEDEFKKEIEEYIEDSTMSGNYVIIKSTTYMNNEEIDLYIDEDTTIDKLFEIEGCIEMWEEYPKMFQAVVLYYNSIEDALLNSTPSEFYLNPTIIDASDLATDTIENMFPEETLDFFYPYVDLVAMGRDIAEEQNGIFTQYGYLRVN